MMTDALKREVEITIETALMLDDSRTTIAELARRIYHAEPALMASLQESWMTDRLRWMLYRKQEHAAASKDQLSLPGFEGLEKLPRRITLRNGKRPELRDATLRQLREFRAVLWDRKDSRIAPLDRLIKLVAEYTEANPGKRSRVSDVIAAKRAEQQG